MDIMLIFKIVTVAVVVSLMNQLLHKAGKEEYSLILTIAGLIIVLSLFLPEFIKLKDEILSVMQF